MAKLHDRVVDLETRLGMDNSERSYSERLLSLLDMLDITPDTETPTPLAETGPTGFEGQLSRLKSLLDDTDLDVTEEPTGTIEDILAILETRLDKDDGPAA